MVKTKGPLGGLQASGTLADIITFSNCGKRNVARKKPRTADARTPAQLSSRAMMTFLSSQWAKLSANQKQTWEIEALRLNASTFNAYAGENLKRWKHRLYPTKTFPAAELLDAAHPWMIGASKLGYVITLGLWAPAINDNWGVVYHHSLVHGFTTDRSNAFLIVEAVTEGISTYPIPRRPAGTYYFRAHDFSIDGKEGDAISNQMPVTLP